MPVGLRAATCSAKLTHTSASIPLSPAQHLKHPDLQTESTALVETALRQWFRILARSPSARLSMPSMLADDMWHEFLLHTRDYASFCDTAFGQFLHHEPESTMSLDQAAANRSDRLLITLERARQDEHCGPHALPLLFRVDQEAGLHGCRRYLVDSGGRERATTRRSQGWCACIISVGRHCWCKVKALFGFASVVSVGRHTVVAGAAAAAGADEEPGPVSVAMRWRERHLSRRRRDVDSVVVLLVIIAVVLLFLLLVASLQWGRVVARRGEHQRSCRG